MADEDDLVVIRRFVLKIARAQDYVDVQLWVSDAVKELDKYIEKARDD